MKSVKVASKLEGLGSLIYFVAPDGTNHCLGDLWHVQGKGTFCPNYGRVDVSAEHAEAHNAALSKARFDAAIEHGRITLYLSCEPASKAFNNGRKFTPETFSRGSGRSTAGHVSDFTGAVKFTCYTSYSRHNIAGYRYDCWFRPGDGFVWHGVQYGDNTQICHCRRTKQKA